MEASSDKTLAVDFGGDERPVVRQSRRMNRIQTEVSGGFDATGGEDILDAVQGLLRSQQRYSEKRTEAEGWAFAPVADVRDDTVARFAAARYRTTYRSLRPMLAEADDTATQRGVAEADDAHTGHRRLHTRSELDDDARAFALGLIEQWVHDPSNVRLLRIGLDIWPAEDVLTGVLDLLRPFTESGGKRKAPRRVAWYCLGEILRAGATETGFVEDGESLPASIDIDAYRSRLKVEAIRLASIAPTALPWYLKQQTLLFLAATAPAEAPVSRTGRSIETRHYREMIRFLRGEGDRVTGADFATLSVLARRSFLSRDAAVELAGIGITPHRIEEVAERDPAFACEVLAAHVDLVAQVSPRVRDDLCLAARPATDHRTSLACVVLDQGRTGPLRNEVSLLRFALMFLERLSAVPSPESAITPVDVWLTLAEPSGGISKGDTLEIAPSRLAPIRSMYSPPLWCPLDERWRFQVGFLLRFILSAKQDFASTVQPPHWREAAATYRKPQGHWYQKVYGLFNGHSAFGDDWLPISDWIERMLFALLSWPGCRYAEWGCVREGIGATRVAIESRLLTLQRLQGPTGSVLLLPLRTFRPDRSTKDRPLRACVIQTVVPGLDDIKRAACAGTLAFSDPTFRARHRNHLSAALAAVERMLDLRETHLERGGRLDWLILPELSVHPRDVYTHLIPFARAHKTIILAGMTYQELLAGQPLVNSALWVIPVWSAAHGLQIITRRQGKKNLAPEEEKINNTGPILQGFRPCQWLLGYEWSAKDENRPLWLTGAICYDATDISLAADLRGRSDVFAIPALNRDVTTFDQMALALHYHMFQLVIIANNGQFGGSNAYWPHKDPWTKQVFHLHGQPQASVAFLEIDDIADFVTRIETARCPTPPSPPGPTLSKWKPPPAGL